MYLFNFLFLFSDLLGSIFQRQIIVSKSRSIFVTHGSYG